MEKKIYLCLFGGLGNQLFQYAYARNLQIKYRLNLVVDHKTGFWFDFRDKRKFELKNLGKIKKKITFFFIFFRFYKKIFNHNKIIFSLFKKKLFDETKCKSFNKIFLSNIRNKKVYLHGFFQSEKYFFENKYSIINELYPKKPKNKLFINVVSELDPVKSVAICIRLFGEVKNSDLIKVGGKLNINYYNKKLEFFKKKIKNPHFYIFSNKENPEFLNLLSRLHIDKKKCTIISADRGFENSYNTLWLLSHFKNQIISNSTFYWWGAYFAKQKFRKVFIKYPTNFPNRDTISKRFF